VLPAIAGHGLVTTEGNVQPFPYAGTLLSVRLEGDAAVNGTQFGGIPREGRGGE